MPGRENLTTRNLNQTAVRWTGATADGFGGRTFDDGTEIDVRWEDKQKLFVDAQGRESVSKAFVFVGVDLLVGDYLMLGDLDDLSSGAEEPGQVATAYEVRAFEKVSNLAGTSFVRKAVL